MSSSSAPTRLYISNLNFSSTEEELFDYLKEYGVKSVLIPSQTIRGFRSNQVRPLGIAYADFESTENVRQAIDDLNGKEFKGRELRLKPYVPYSPATVTKKLHRVRHLSKLRHCHKPKESEVVQENAQNSEQRVVTPDPAPGSSSVSNSENTNHISLVSVSRNGKSKMVAPDEKQSKDSNAIEESEFSEDTVYCGYLPKSVTDTAIRQYFQDFNPQEIWIFRTKQTKSRHFQIHRHFTAALVSFEADVNSHKISEAVQKKKLLGKKIIVKPAYLSKIEELKEISKQSILVDQETDSVVIEEPTLSGPQEKTLGQDKLA